MNRAFQLYLHNNYFYNASKHTTHKNYIPTVHLIDRRKKDAFFNAYCVLLHLLIVHLCILFFK